MLNTHFNASNLVLKGLTLAACLLVSACAITPETIVKLPMTAKPAAVVPLKANNGGIFTAAAYHPMFEDRIPRYVGDILTINITENTNAIKAGEHSGSKVGSANTSISSLFGHAVPKATFAGSSTNTFDNKADEKSSNIFNGSITVTVVDVLPNGNLEVSGEKQISFDNGTEFVRFSGVVSPDSITVGNFVPSNKVADARIEYRTNSKIDGAGIASMAARFFLSVLPL